MVYVRDVVSALVDIGKDGEKTHGKIFNIAGDEVWTLKKYVGMVAKELDPLVSQKPKYDDNKVALLPSYDVGCLDNSLAKRVLSTWKPTPVEIWLPKVISWYKDEKNIKYTYDLVTQAMKDSEEAKNKQQKAVNKKKMARKQLTRKSKKWLA